jgi:DNA-binding NtrC family response regulator
VPGFSDRPLIEGDLNYGLARERVLEAFDRKFLEQLLDKHGGNTSAASAEAGIDRKTFTLRLNKGRNIDE